jgi:hypothetical protein
MLRIIEKIPTDIQHNILKICFFGRINIGHIRLPALTVGNWPDWLVWRLRARVGQVINRCHQRRAIFHDRAITRPFWGELVIGILMGNRSG